MFLWTIFAIVVISAIGIPLWLASGKPVATSALVIVRRIFLWLAGIFAAGMTLIGVAAAAWGMDTRLFWDVALYLVPIIALPCFLLLLVSVRALSRTLWIITLLSPVTFALGQRAEKLASFSSYRPDGNEILGYVLNAFTLCYLAISTLVQLALACHKREQVQRETETAIS